MEFSYHSTYSIMTYLTTPSSNETRKLSSIEDRGQTDRVRVGVRVGVDLDLQSQESYGHDP